MEPWPCFLSWQQQAAGRLHPPRLKMEVRARHRLDVNITSVLLGKTSRPTVINVDFWPHSSAFLLLKPANVVFLFISPRFA